VCTGLNAEMTASASEAVYFPRLGDRLTHCLPEGRDANRDLLCPAFLAWDTVLINNYRAFLAAACASDAPPAETSLKKPFFEEPL